MDDIVTENETKHGVVDTSLKNMKSDIQRFNDHIENHSTPHREHFTDPSTDTYTAPPTGQNWDLSQFINMLRI
jgi:hypothetical protein